MDVLLDEGARVRNMNDPLGTGGVFARPLPVRFPFLLCFRISRFCHGGGILIHSQQRAHVRRRTRTTCRGR